MAESNRWLYLCRQNQDHPSRPPHQRESRCQKRDRDNRTGKCRHPDDRDLPQPSPNHTIKHGCGIESLHFNLCRDVTLAWSKTFQLELDPKCGGAFKGSAILLFWMKQKIIPIHRRGCGKDFPHSYIFRHMTLKVIESHPASFIRQRRCSFRSNRNSIEPETKQRLHFVLCCAWALWRRLNGLHTLVTCYDCLWPICDRSATSLFISMNIICDTFAPIKAARMLKSYALVTFSCLTYRFVSLKIG